MTRRAAVLLVAAAAWLLAGCEVPSNDEPVELSGPFSQLSTTTTTSTTPPETDSKAVQVFMLLRDDGATTLQAVERQLDADAGIQDVLTNLFTQPPSAERGEAGLETAIPSSAVLLSAEPSAADETRLIVDVRGLLGSEGLQGPELRNALAQIVWTATEGAGFESVVFRNDGAPADVLVDELESTGQAVRKTDYARTVA